ncbi:MAG: methylated-DNA--[protein]-cysteine S-methyltransferase [Candidatus Eisenbacteria bacterium]|nr:methylated-DNA--[protein]-cysteine S-methyltransferase [Candidatus Eisenbacteria bacterium]
MSPLRYSTLETPHGTVWFAAGEEGLKFLLLRYFNDRRVLQELRKARGSKLVRDDRALKAFAGQLKSYFEGRRVAFDVRLDLSTGTRFQQAVWRAVGRIPYGTLVSYKRVAREVGSPMAARAVGNALAANPIPIVIPCHRVVRTDGGLGGFTGGIRWKKRLIELELGQRGLDFTEAS